MPCWGRPERTRRAIWSVLNQTVKEWELLCIGDACPVLAGIECNDPRVIIHNMPEHEGKYGTQCLNHGLSIARGEWVCYLGNDDYVLPTHLMTRLAAVSDEFDVVHFDALLARQGGFEVRKSMMSHGTTGGSELIVRTEISKRVGWSSGAYGHDWTFIEGLQAAGARRGYCPLPPTYVVTHLPGTLSESGID
jgi:glycosyltransferase involved in cell wall biosynthesis